jgi:hypothetical protein
VPDVRADGSGVNAYQNVVGAHDGRVDLGEPEIVGRAIGVVDDRFQWTTLPISAEPEDPVG